MSMNCLREIDVVVLAGGRGSRVAHVLKDIPKILAPIGNRFYIDLLLAWLNNFGAKRIIFSLGHLAAPVINYLESLNVDTLDFCPVVEKRPEGTAVAIRNISSYIKTNPVLVINGDSFVNADLCSFLNFHQLNQNEASILCTKVENAGRYGMVNISSEKRIISFEEKSKYRGAGFINAGVYLFDKTAIAEIIKSGPSLEIDFLAKQEKNVIGVMAGHYDFLDIGTPEALIKAPVMLDKFFI